MADNEKQARDDRQEISDKDLESVSGGEIDGGCIPPFEPTPTFPDFTR